MARKYHPSEQRGERETKKGKRKVYTCGLKIVPSVMYVWAPPANLS